MTRTLRHATALTDHREFERLDQSLLQSVVELTGSGARRSASALRCRLWRPESGAPQARLQVGARCDSLQARHDPAEERDMAALARHALDERRTLQRCEPDALAPGHARHRLWIPIERHGHALAVLEIDTAQPLPAGRLTLVQGMCSLYANHLSLLHESQVDTLTQLLNRKTFDDSIQRLLNSPQDGQPSWIAVVDIDHFKRINDSYGHLFGDEVLLLVAGVLRQSFRQQDKVFRFGGEEFVILLRQVDEEGALAALERLRTAIETRAFPQVGRVTVSIGATRARSGDAACDVLGRADDALYHAKSNGRNQLRVFEHLRADGDITAAATVHGEIDLF